MLLVKKMNQDVQHILAAQAAEKLGSLSFYLITLLIHRVNLL